MSIRTYVRTDILTLERGDMLGYLILLPLVLMFKVLNDGVHLHIHYDTSYVMYQQIAENAFVTDVFQLS